MIKPNVTVRHALPSPLFAQLDSREVALWLHGDGDIEFNAEQTSRLCRLPWNVVLCERFDTELIAELEAPEAHDAPLVRRRGLLHLVDSDPAETILPPRHLAVMLLNGRAGQRQTGMAALTRRLTMLQDLRKRSIKQLIVVVSGPFGIPEELGEMWADGYRTTVTFVSSDPEAVASVNQWRQTHAAPFLDVIDLSPAEFSAKLDHEYLQGRDGRFIVRMRDEHGELQTVDVTDLDDPERPILRSYDLLGTETLIPLLPSDLTSSEVEGFFADPGGSWRPFAAGIVWERDKAAWEKVRSRLRALDRRGPEENRIFYVQAESGAGATTFLRDLAWRAASVGYPTLIARRGPSTVSGLEVAGFIRRLVNAGSEQSESGRLYETPCLLVFDQNHWAGQDAELISFAREIERSGRRVCIVIATGPYVGTGILGEQRFIDLASLTHRIQSEKAVELGLHLNRFLAPHGTARSEQEWRAFVKSTSVGSNQGIAAFWIVLSFWLQRQIDLGETIQSRLYRQFKEVLIDEQMKVAVLRIAAFSTVGEPLPDPLLPEASDWPVSSRIEDMRKELGLLALIRIQSELDRYWAMAHDLLGRYLITGLFYDHQSRQSLGYGNAANAEHLRFLILKEISSQPCLQRADLRSVAEAFAVSIFKIDPEHGYATLAPFWRQVLEALDEMPRVVRATSRTFLHHVAISRRRIASDPQMFVMSDIERVELLRRAVEDIEAALGLDGPPGSETDINLYNSLAHAYHDLAEAEATAQLDSSIAAASRAKAQDATRRAYSLNPDNSFVVETFARSLLSEGADDERFAAQKALEVLTLVYGLMERSTSEPRRNALGRLSERAFDLLLEHGGAANGDSDTEVGAIAIALSRLAAGVNKLQGLRLSDLPKENRVEAAALLAAPPIAGNVQAVKLRYMLTVLDQPLAFDLQLELLQSLQGAGPVFTPQMELELAALLFQMDRPHEGDQLFRRLRGLWRRGDHFVEVPTRLHWLLDSARNDRRQVRGKVKTNSDGRAFAQIADFQNAEVPLRAAEFGEQLLRAGSPVAGYVSFGHNGPLLRPLTAPRR